MELEDTRESRKTLQKKRVTWLILCKRTTEL